MEAGSVAALVAAKIAAGRDEWLGDGGRRVEMCSVSTIQQTAQRGSLPEGDHTISGHAHNMILVCYRES